jgi:hypothetical protein
MNGNGRNTRGIPKNAVYYNRDELAKDFDDAVTDFKFYYKRLVESISFRVQE